MRRPRRTPSSSTPDSNDPLRPISPDRGGEHFVLPETVQQVSRTHSSTAGSNSISSNNNGVGAMTAAASNVVGPMRRRKRGSAGSSSKRRRSVLFHLRRWLFSSSKQHSSWDDPLRVGGLSLSSGRKHNNARVQFPIVGLLALVAICLFCMYRVMSAHGPSSIGNETRLRFLSGSVSALAAKPFRVSFDIDPADVVKGRWFVQPKPLTAWDRMMMKQHDFGGLQIRFFEDVGLRQQKRVIYHDFKDDWGVHNLKSGPNDDDASDFYYAFDDDAKRNPLVGWDDPDIQDEKQCRRTSWHRDLPINCNSVHEYDIYTRFSSGDTKFLGDFPAGFSAGAYRQVYLSKLLEGDFVFKEYIWDSEYALEDYEFMRMDAIVAERLYWSPRIVDIYAFCGLGMINEAMQNGDMEHIAVPTGNGRSSSYEGIENSSTLKVYNTLAGTQKLEYALDMAEAVLLLHSYPDGVIVHDDIQLSQFLLSKEGTLKLNDFNRAEIMLFNEKDNEYCRYRNNPGHGDWRAPEEYFDKPLNEQIDIWSLGNNFYALLTGYYPLPDSDTKRVQRVLKRGETAFVDPRYLERSFAEKCLAEIIPRCWIYDPDKRITIFDLVTQLRQAVRENARRDH